MLRLIDIFKVIIKYDLDDYLFRNSKHKSLFIAKQSVKKFLRKTPTTGTFGYRLKCALEELGPVFVKIGQMMSSRPDLFPKGIIDELKLLRESVTPFDSDIAVQIIESELKIPIKNIFDNFSITPAASGSVAQVHYATLLNGDEVAVKILRPNIEKTIKKDIELFKQIVNLIYLYNPTFKKINLKKVIEELVRSFSYELNLELEAQNIQKFKKNTETVSFVHVPKIYENYITKNVLIMERMYGTPIDQKDKLQDQGVDIEKVVIQGLEILMLQVFHYGFFHADQHPGNLWIKPDGSRIYLDFGIMGNITENDRKTLLKILFFLYANKHDKVIEVLQETNWISTDVSSNNLIDDLTSISKMLVNKKQKDLSLGNIFKRFIEIIDKYDSKIPYQFTLLAKTIIVTEGIVKQLYPNLDIEKEAIPILIKYFK